jgi:hypothetical protein
MSKELMEVVLPRLARPLYRHLNRYQNGKLSDTQFVKRFEAMLKEQHDWLAAHGVAEARAALAIHAAVLVLSAPGLRAEALREKIPLEVVEQKALRDAAADLARNYGVNERRAADRIARILAKYAD